VSLPFQTVETVNESAQERQRTLDFFAADRQSDWRNRLIWGDKKYVLPALLNEFAGKVDLIYIDPPFATGQNFSLPLRVEDADFVKQPSMIEVKAYRDTWGAGLDSYLEWFYGMAVHFHGLLNDTGSLYVHLDPGVSHLVKALLDEVFGLGNFRSEIIWKRTSAHSSARRYGPVHDTLLFYSKSDLYIWNEGHQAYDAVYVKQRFKRGGDRPWKDADLTQAGTRAGETGKSWRGFNPTHDGRHWFIPPTELDKLDAEGRIYWPAKKGGWPRLRQFLDELAGVALQDVWTDLSPINSQAAERLGYPTQKPEALLQRVIAASTNPGDLVLDCVCGSGTTAVAAEKLNRRWIVADLGRFAIHITRKRLLGLEGVTPFEVQNLGKYERQIWQLAEFGETAEARTSAYRAFILDLYQAQQVNGYAWLHGLKRGRMVHVGTVDAPVTVGDIKQIVAEFRKSVGTGKNAPKEQKVDILGWDFAFELNEIARQDAERAGIELRLVRIPREVLDKRAVEQGDVRFFELAALSVKLKQSGQQVTMVIEDFVIPLDDVPADVQKAITHWEQWIDYWAVDWDNKDDTFHNEWQAYRTTNSRDLALSTEHEYEELGEYTVVVKVIDILGNDTTKTMSVKVAGRGA